MTSDKWKHLFQRQILYRGYDYWKQGRVKSLNMTEDTWTARVQGSEAYDVSIDWKDGKVSAMHCSCPYAADGTPCKHMAAVLFEAEDQDRWIDEGESPILDFGPAVEEEIRNMIWSIPVQDLQGLLLEEAQINPDLGARLAAQYTNSVGVHERNRRIRELNHLEDLYLGNGYRVHPRQVSAYLGALENFLRENVVELADNGCLEDALELNNDVFSCVMSYANGEWYGSAVAPEVVKGCVENWTWILHGVSARRRETIQRDLEDLVSGYQSAGEIGEILSAFMDEELE